MMIRGKKVERKITTLCAVLRNEKISLSTVHGKRRKLVNVEQMGGFQF